MTDPLPELPEEWLSGWIDQELTSAQRARCARALHEDPQLRQRLQALTAADRRWRAAASPPEALPPALRGLVSQLQRGSLRLPALPLALLVLALLGVRLWCALAPEALVLTCVVQALLIPVILSCFARWRIALSATLPP